MTEIIVNSEKNILNPNSITFTEREEELEKLSFKETEKNKRDKNSPFSNFYQFNREHSKDMIKLAGKYPKSHQILLFLLDQMDNYNAVMCSYKVFEEALEISTSTVKRAIKVLKDNGFIMIYKSGTSNVYAINKNLAWSSWGKNHKYAKFDAKIIISENEQTETINLKNIKHKEITIDEK